jgi:hypothetical protein
LAKTIAPFQRPFAFDAALFDKPKQSHWNVDDRNPKRTGRQMNEEEQGS